MWPLFNVLYYKVSVAFANMRLTQVSTFLDSMFKLDYFSTSLINSLSIQCLYYTVEYFTLLISRFELIIFSSDCFLIVFNRQNAEKCQSLLSKTQVAAP